MEQRWLEKKEWGQCVCARACVRVVGAGGGVNTIPHLLLQQTIHAMIKGLGGVRGWVVIVVVFCFFLNGRYTSFKSPNSA